MKLFISLKAGHQCLPSALDIACLIEQLEDLGFQIFKWLPLFQAGFNGVGQFLQARHTDIATATMQAVNLSQQRLQLLLLQGMRESANQNPEKPLMLRHDGHWEPLLCVIPVALLPAFEAA